MSDGVLDRDANVAERSILSRTWIRSRFLMSSWDIIVAPKPSKASTVYPETP
jgi:hypothetical protein